MLHNKNEIKIFYQTHDLSIKQVSEHFQIPYRTLAHWIKKEGWERAGALKSLSQKQIQSQIVQKEFGSVIGAVSENIKKELKANLGNSAYDVDEIVLNNMLESSTDEILLKAMSLNFIQKNQALSVIMAKNELMALIANKDPNKPDPMIIACAEKVAKLFSDLGVSLYGKDPSMLSLQAHNSNDFENLSEVELKKILSEQESN